MKTISIDSPVDSPVDGSVVSPVASMNSALAVLEMLDSVVVERCTEPSCEVCAQELDIAA